MILSNGLTLNDNNNICIHLFTSYIAPYHHHQLNSTYFIISNNDIFLTANVNIIFIFFFFIRSKENFITHTHEVCTSPFLYCIIHNIWCLRKKKNK